MLDPYVILDLPRDASPPEVRARYMALAKQHHPDRHSAATEEERRRHEAIFQRVTLAYDQIQSGQARQSESESTDLKRWQDIWGRFSESQGLKDFGDLLKRTFRDVVGRTKIHVTLEEIHNHAHRKVRIWETNTVHTIDCGERVHHLAGQLVEIVAKPHPVFRQDPLLNDMDLYCTLTITLKAYLFGETRTLRHLDGRDLAIQIHPWQDVRLPIVVPGEGLQHRDNLYVGLDLRLPTSFENLDPTHVDALCDWLARPPE